MAKQPNEPPEGWEPEQQDGPPQKGEVMPAKQGPAQAARAVAQSRHAVINKLEKARASFAAVAPEGANVDRMMALWRSTLLQDRKLLDADPRSVLLAIRESVRLDLEPGGPLGQCWIQAFRRDAVMLLGYKGMIELAARAGISIDAGAIYETDAVEYREGAAPVLNITRPWPPVDRGVLLGAYAVATLPDGRKKPIVIGYNDDMTERARRASHSNGGKTPAQKGMAPWEDWWLAKTAIRRLCATLPQAPELQKRAAIEEHAEQGIIHPPLMIEGEWDEDVVD